MKYVISIGINNVKGLTPLKAAVSGAIEFNDWAETQGYETFLFADNDNNVVSQSDIFNQINSIIEEKTCEQLIVFFSGHGILKGPNQEVWLLSNAKSNPNESINLTGSVDNARTSGIPYIVFVSDACRILPTEIQFTGNGSVIFPILDDTNEDCAIDLLYATRPGSPANEFNSKKSSKKFGLFTQSIIEILKGDYPDLIGSQNASGRWLTNYYDLSLLQVDQNYKSLNNADWHIDTINIEYPLKSVVSKKASEIKITLTQNPEIRIQYQNPKPKLANFSDDEAKQILLKTNKELRSGKLFESDLHDRIQKDLEFGLKDLGNNSFKSILGDLGAIPGHMDAYKIKSNLISNSERIFDSKGRESFETQTGFTIVGNTVQDVITNGNRSEKFFENNKEQIRIYNDDQITSALIILKNGNSIPIAILKGYIGTLVFNENKLLTVNYTPSRNNYKYEEFKRNEKEINFVRAFIASSANEGFDYQNTFNKEFDDNGRMNYDNAGSFLRREKSLDPSLGLYAVYAYRQAGKIKDVKSVYRYMREESDRIPFDVAMLADKIVDERSRLAPFCPMLSLGWAYRQKFDEFLHPQIREASNYLVPTLWTTFDKKVTESIINLFTENILK